MGLFSYLHLDGKPHGAEWKKKLTLLRGCVPEWTRVLPSYGADWFLKEICERWNQDQEMNIQISLQVLFLMLEDTNNHGVSDLFHKLLEISPYKILNALVEIEETDQETNAGKDKRSNQGGSQSKVKTAVDFTHLRKIMLSAAERKQKIKAVSTDFSRLWTDIGDSKGIIIDTSRLNEKLPIEFLDDESQKEFYNFGAGITMKQIQEVLWPKGERMTRNPGMHRILENVTNGTALSLAGTVSTGAHGNGLNTGIVADAVVSFQMFTIDKDWNVKRYQIERSTGFTNKGRFEEKYSPAGNKDDNFELIQDDKTFNATVVNIGCIGVVYSYVLKTKQGFYLEEERTIYKWEDAKNKILELYSSGDADLYNFQVIGSPYAYKLCSDETDDHRVLISVLRKVTTVKHVSSRPKSGSPVSMEFLEKALVAVGNSYPHVVPILMHFSLKALQHEKIVLNGVEALNTLSGIVEQKSIGVRTSECAMRLNGPETVIDIMEDLHELYNDIRRSNDRQLVNVPIALRFTAKSDIYMAMGYDRLRPTVTIEQSIIDGTLGADDTLRKFRKRMLNNFAGRPHWGLLHEMNAEKLKRLYDSNCRIEFNSALKRFDPKFVFENDFAAWVFGNERSKPSHTESAK